jgi:hypothetical protein
VPAKPLPRTRPKRVQRQSTGNTWYLKAFLLYLEASIQSSHAQLERRQEAGRCSGAVGPAKSIPLSCASARPPEHVRQMVQALSRASPESDEQRGIALLSLLTLDTPTYSLFLHLLHNISAPQSLPCIRKQSPLSSQHADSPCLGMSK